MAQERNLVDSLTGLTNLDGLHDRLRPALEIAKLDHQQVAVLFIGVDHFTRVVDTVGYSAASGVLKQFADRIAGCVQPTDIVARTDGDEFVVVLVETDENDRSPSHVAERILAATSAPVTVDDQELFIGCSIGAALYPQDGQTDTTLIDNAHTAMYRAKEQGRLQYQFYAAGMRDHVRDRLSLEEQLRWAVERNEFLLHYQPRVELKTGQVTEVEALIRWQHPEKGRLLPIDFISLAEETGLIIPIGDWVLHTACTQNKAWQVQGLPPVRVTVNVSALQFSRPDFARIIQDALKQTGLEPKYLGVEITETLMVHDADAASIAAMFTLPAAGIQLAVDNFGTGYSSLSSLAHLPVDVLQVDRSFVRDCTTDADSAAVLKGIVALARSLGISVVAEGVEKAEQLDFLRTSGYDMMQGFLFSKPLPSTELGELLRQGRSLPA